MKRASVTEALFSCIYAVTSPLSTAGRWYCKRACGNVIATFIKRASVTEALFFCYMPLIPLVNSGPMVLQTCVRECYSHFYKKRASANAKALFFCYMPLIPLVYSGPMVLQMCVWECYSHFYKKDISKGCPFFCIYRCRQPPLLTMASPVPGRTPRCITFSDATCD